MEMAQDPINLWETLAMKEPVNFLTTDSYNKI